MNLKKNLVVLAAFAIATASASNSRADIVYVDANAAAPIYGELGLGNGGPQAGTFDDPFGSIQAAYHELWNKAGHHEIRLVEGTYTGSSIGIDNNNAYTDMIFLDALTLPGNPSWSSVTLKPASGTVVIDRNFPTEDLGGKAPTRYESLSANIDRAALFRLPLGNPNFNGMIVQDVVILLGGGTSLVGSQGTGVQQWTFNNVKLFLESQQTTLPNYGNVRPGRSALFGHHNGDANLTGSFFDFNNSTIYVDPNTDEAGKSDGMFVGYRWFVNDPFPDGFFDGNNTSQILRWTTGTPLTGSEPQYAGDIWSSKRSTTGSTLYHLKDTGGTQAGGFLVNFNVIPEPTTALMVSLAGAAFLMLGRRRGSRS